MVFVETKIELSRLFDWVQSVIKTRQDNDVTDRTGSFFVENDIELLWLIKLIAIYDKY